MSKAIETIIVRLGLTVTSYESLQITTASHPIYELPTSSEGKLSLKNIDDQSTHQFELDEKFVSLVTFTPFQPFLWRPLSWWNCMLRCTRTFQQPNLAITPLNQTLQLLWMNWFQIGGFGYLEVCIKSLTQVDQKMFLRCQRSATGSVTTSD